MNSLKKIIKHFILKIFGKDVRSKKIKRVRDQIKRQPLKIVVGAGGVFEDGWIETDIDILNLVKKSDWNRLFKPNSISIILAEHVWEHLTLEQGKVALLNCYTFLNTGGHFRVAVPDGFHPDPDYIEYVKPGGYGAGADDHKILYNFKLLQSSMEEIGFKVNLLEYFDEDRMFHFDEWNKDDGMIWRSKRFDERNKNGLLNYTSLIMDGVK